MSKSGPKAPDYEAAAEQQAQSSREVTEQQTWANRPTQNTPFGQSTWDNTPTWDPATQQYVNKWTQNINLTPESQAALDSQQRIQQGRSGLAESMLTRVNNEFSPTMDWSKMPQGGQSVAPGQLQTSLDFSGAPEVSSGADTRNRAEEAIYSRAKSRLDPRFSQEEGDIRSRLYGQGLREGDAAWEREMGNFGRSKEDAYQTAMTEAIMGGGAEAARDFGMDSARRSMFTGEAKDVANFGNQAVGTQLGLDTQAGGFNTQLRQQAIAEEMQKRGFSLNEINAILTGQQVGMPGMPSFSNATKSEGVQALQAAQLTGQANLDAFNAEQQALQGMMSGVGSVAGGFMGFSDRRLKDGVRLIGKFRDINIYRWKYLWGEEAIGVMADEVEHIPNAVVTDPVTGIKMVDYGVVLNG